MFNPQAIIKADPDFKQFFSEQVDASIWDMHWNSKHQEYQLLHRAVSFHPWKDRRYEASVHARLTKEQGDHLLKLEAEGLKVLRAEQAQRDADKAQREAGRAKWAAAWKAANRPNVSVSGKSVEIVDDHGNPIDRLAESCWPENTSDEDIEKFILHALDCME